MNSLRFLVESDILIDVSRGHVSAIQYLDSLAGEWALSQVSAPELIVGARDKRELASIDQFLLCYPLASLTENIGATAYSLLKAYAKSSGLHVFDSLIAATAIEMQLTLVTRNRKHYPMIRGLSLDVLVY